MSEDTLRLLIENWEQVGIGLFLFLALVAAGFLFFTDRILSPKSIADLREEIRGLKAECDEKDKLADRVAGEIADARVLFAKAEAELSHLKHREADVRRDRDECRTRLQRLEVEREMRERYGRASLPESEP